MTEKERLWKALFEDPKRVLVNIKFFRGSATAMPVEAFCGQVTAALEQFDTNLLACTARIEENFPTVDVAELAKAK